MPEMTKFDPGTFCWTELGTTDQNAAKTFYSQLFGWQIEDSPMPDGRFYSMGHLGGKYTAGMYGMPQEMLDQNIPPHWMNYVAVESVNSAITKAKELGATIMMEPMDVMDVGRMAVIQDPTGAVLSLWEPKQHQGAGLFNEIGAMSWTELQTHDVDKAKDFYSKMFGWGIGGDANYTEFKFGDMSHAGMMKIAPEWGPVPPNWGVYFRVENCDATVDKAKSMGANVLVPAQDIENVGRFSVLQDPQGAVFSVIQLTHHQ